MQLNAVLINRFTKPEPWIKLAGALMLVLVTYMSAKLVWVWVDVVTADYAIKPAPVSRPTATSVSSRLVSVDAIVSKHLFGDATAKPVEQAVVEVAATETRLPLKLRGIYAADNEQRASAIIESGGNQEVYFLGDKITGGRGAVLHKVQATKVILNTNGQLESLTLEQEESVISMEPDRLTSVASGRSGDEEDLPEKMQGEVIDNPRIKRELGELREKLQSDPTSLRDMLQWEPVMENGQIQGVKISPGKARRLFYELKLRRNDVVTNINGVPLNDPSQLLMLQQNLATSDEVSLTILRNGQTQDITIRLNDNER